VNGIIWLLTGSCGQYDDRVEWVVAAYIAESDAQADCDFLTTIANQTDGFSREGSIAWRELHLHDSKVSDSCGIIDRPTYGIEEVSFLVSRRFV